LERGGGKTLIYEKKIAWGKKIGCATLAKQVAFTEETDNNDDNALALTAVLSSR